jgi:hypothetical protein
VCASTTEALTVTILSELLRRASLNSVPRSVSVIFDDVYAAELDHWNFIEKVFRPSTERFWIPDGFFGGPGDALDLTAVGQGVAAGEHLFVNTYLLGVTILAAAGQSTFARYAAELAGVEAEHRVLGQYLAGASPPNNLGFEVSEFSTVSAIEAALMSAGFGLGSRARPPGASTSSRTRRCRRRSRSARIRRRRPNRRRPVALGEVEVLGCRRRRDRPMLGSVEMRRRTAAAAWTHEVICSRSSEVKRETGPDRWRQPTKGALAYAGSPSPSWGYPRSVVGVTLDR